MNQTIASIITHDTESPANHISYMFLRQKIGGNGEVRVKSRFSERGDEVSRILEILSKKVFNCQDFFQCTFGEIRCQVDAVLLQKCIPEIETPSFIVDYFSDAETFNVVQFTEGM